MAVATDPATERVIASTSILRAGQFGQVVADLQRALAGLGFDPGPVDGVFGPTTDSALRSFQAVAGVAVDGTVGPQTRRAIAVASGTSVQVTPPDRDSRSALSAGATGDDVAALQGELARAGLYRGPRDGLFGPATESAVVAFHKVRRQERSSTWFSSDWDLISGWHASAPGFGSAPDRIEIDLGRQVLFVVRGGSVKAVMPISSANGETYTSANGSRTQSVTPRGDFRLFRNVNGWDISYLGELFEPWYFSGGYAIHGSNSVPTHPASHGCVRVSIADMLWLDPQLRLGMPIHVAG